MIFIIIVVWAGHRLVGGLINSEHRICIYSIINNPLVDVKSGQRWKDFLRWWMKNMTMVSIIWNNSNVKLVEIISHQKRLTIGSWLMFMFNSMICYVVSRNESMKFEYEIIPFYRDMFCSIHWIICLHHWQLSHWKKSITSTELVLLDSFAYRIITVFRRVS